MVIRLFDGAERKRLKAAERAADQVACERGDAASRQERNSFIGNAQTWVIEEVPAPFPEGTVD